METNGARTPMNAMVVNHNGPPPLAAIQIGCAYTILSSGGTAQIVKTKPTFSLSPSSPSGTKPTGWVEVWRGRVYVPSCAGLVWIGFPSGLSFTDTTHWTDKVIDFPTQNAKITDAGNFSSSLGTLTASSRSGGVISFNVTFSSSGLVIPAGTTDRESSIWINTAGASSGDRIQLLPGSVASWKGTDNPSGYPASIQAPDLAAAVGNVITF